MKKITMTFALIVAMMAQSCQKEDLSEVTSEQDFDAAYISLTINSSATRASDSPLDGTTDAGTTAENKISSLALLAFDTNYDYIDAYSVSVYESSKFICEVAPDSRRFFAVVNPTTEIWKAIDGVASFSQSAFSSLDAIVMTAASASTGNDNGFVMVNCGAKNTNGILLESLVTIDATSLGTTEDTATALTINVDRLVSKFQYSVSSSFSLPANTNGQIDGVALTATNKASYLYSMIYLDNLTGGNVYRTDHNMSVGKLEEDTDEANEVIAALEANFNWLTNGSGTTDAAFVAPDDAATSPEYVLENTCEPSYSNSNNLTQAIVKAQYNPLMTNGSTLSLGTSWFKMYTSSGDGTLYLTFDEVVALYNDTYGGFTATAATKASMNVQLNNILGTTGKAWDDGDFTLATLDACTYGGYKAATVALQTDYVLQYYQKAVNYYDIFIQHDDAIAVGHAGRWGMVRNNSYTMAITGISKEGLPYIPDPTDPAIVDPENQDPMDPEPADKLDAYIAVSITVNPWVLWYQESVLE